MYYTVSLIELMIPTLSVTRRPLFRRFLSSGTRELPIVFAVPLPLAFFYSKTPHTWTRLCNAKKVVYLSELRIYQK